MSAFNTWAICCPGPSFHGDAYKEKIKAFKPSYLIAVNGAILEDYDFDFWSIQDIEIFNKFFEKELLHTIIKRQPYATLWIPERWMGDIPRYYSWLDCDAAFHSFSKRLFPSESVEAFAKIMPFGKDINWREYTLFVSIALAILNNAEEIRIYGADWSGKGYCHKDLENEKTIHTEKRWRDESFKFETIHRVCEEYEIKLTRETL